MKIIIPKIDLSAEIKKWKSAVYGKEVREAQISALEKSQLQMNTAVDFIVEKGNAVDNTVAEVNRVKQEAQQAVDIATNKAIAAAGSATEAVNQAKISESWAVGQTGKRPDENANNSKYWSEESKRQADHAKSEADRAAQYSKIVVPRFHIDYETMELIQDTESKGITFKLSEDKELTYEFV